MIYYEMDRSNPKGGIYYQSNQNLKFRQHLHDSFEWIFVFEGEIDVTVDTRCFTVGAGNAILIFPNQIHQANTRTQSRTSLFVFENSLIGEFARIAKKSAVENPVFPIDGAALFARMQAAGTSRYFLKAYLYEMVATFEENCGAYSERKGKPAEHIGQVLTFIAEHYAESISMQDAAKEIGYDYHYLSNLLQKGMHTTFRTLLNEYRVSYAKYLLLTSQHSISQIAGECGYESLCSFNRNFKEQSGITPTAYRERGARKNPRECQENG